VELLHGVLDEVGGVVGKILGGFLSTLEGRLSPVGDLSEEVSVS